MPSINYQVFVECSHVEDRRNEIAPMGYGFLIRGPGIEPSYHYGFGAEKDTQAFLAHGLERAVSEIFLECPDPSISVVKRKIGTEKFLTEFVPGWLRKIADGAPGFSRHSLQVWKRLYEMSRLSQLTMKKPEGAHEKDIVKEVKKFAIFYAEHAKRHRDENATLYENIGVFITDESRQPSAKATR